MNGRDRKWKKGYKMVSSEQDTVIVISDTKQHSRHQHGVHTGMTH